MPHKKPSQSKQATKPHYDYKSFSQIAGPFGRLPRKNYRVQYKRLTQGRDIYTAILLVLANIGIELAFLIWIFLPNHVVIVGDDPWLKASVIVILIGILIVEGSRLLNMLSLCLSTLIARSPIPVRPLQNQRVAFTTAIVPSKEPFEMVYKTLVAATKIKYKGTFDVWLLDEGNVPEIKEACEKIGVKHFSRKGIEKYNQSSGGFKAKTKHGNHNGWLDAHGDDYDYVISVDSDHVPMPNFAQRMLGYFRDPDVAFVVGPQVYGNYDNLVTKGAESQSYLFQAAIQRAGNAYNAAMFVGTNHAYRISAWRSINGFQDSITEDMFTSMVVHTTANPATGANWKSVYTPDVIAVGEGPSSWADYFSQQLRWSRGSNEIMVVNFLKLWLKMSWKHKLHYFMLIAYYPSVAVAWVVGLFVTMLYLVFAQNGVNIPWQIWLALYIDVMVAQLLLYGWLRKFNVSPHEEKGTLGVPGMFLSMLAVPMYVTALTAAIFRRKTSFVVTPKGDSTSPDGWGTFQKHFLWAGLIVEFLIYSILTGHSYPGVKIWSAMTIAICLAPPAIWFVSDLRKKKFRWSARRVFTRTRYNAKLSQSKEI